VFQILALNFVLACSQRPLAETDVCASTLGLILLWSTIKLSNPSLNIIQVSFESLTDDALHVIPLGLFRSLRD
jgi:hypothetical protein